MDRSHIHTFLDALACVTDDRVFHLAMGGVAFVGLCIIIPVLFLKP